MRNFAIIAHIDAGKSTLSDRILELTGSLSSRDTKAGQVLDKLQVERERGITVKAQSATMLWRDHFLLNLLDTPGHVDFGFEVKRSLTACQGALLLVDSTQGVQAQTLANFELAKAAGLTIIPTLTKLDLKTSDPDTSLRQMETLLGIHNQDEVIWCSAKTGEGVVDCLNAVVDRIPCPPLPPDTIPETASTLQAKVLDLWHDQYRGVVVLIVVNRGRMSSGERIMVIGEDGMPITDSVFEVKEVGINTPTALAMEQGLGVGRIGYLLAVNSKGAKRAYIGATLVSEKVGKAILRQGPCNLSRAQSMALIRSKPTVFASIYPVLADDFDELKKSINKLQLNDSSVVAKEEASGALGNGFRCGFLGSLHMEVFTQRLEDEFNAQLISTAPSVVYTCKLRDGQEVRAEKPSQLPPPGEAIEILEPIVRCTLISPVEYVSEIMEELVRRRAKQEKIEPIDEGARTKLIYRVPWSEAVSDFQEVLKALSSGFASFDFSECEPEAADIVRVDMLLNGEKAEPLAFVAHRSSAERRGREVAKRLKDVIPSQQFDVVIQAAIGSKVVARETLRGMRKNVLEKSGKLVGGGDITRKRKLLDRQKQGKERLKSVGSVQLNQDAFRAVLDRRGGS